MSYSVKKNITNIISSTLLTLVYSIIIYTKYQNGDFDTSNIFSFWAMVILILIPISVGVKIVSMIVLNIIDTAVSSIKGNDLEQDSALDERDKLIVLKSFYGSMMIFVIGFIVALLTQVFGASGHVFFIVIYAFGYATDIASEGMNIYYNRKGI